MQFVNNENMCNQLPTLSGYFNVVKNVIFLKQQYIGLHNKFLTLQFKQAPLIQVKMEYLENNLCLNTSFAGCGCFTYALCKTEHTCTSCYCEREGFYFYLGSCDIKLTSVFIAESERKIDQCNTYNNSGTSCYHKRT